MKFSQFGRRFSEPTGITTLMDDLGRAMAGQDDMHMLGGGNPAHIPAVQAIWRKRMQEILADGDAYERMLSNYDTPRGNPQFIGELAAFLNRHFGWGISEENIAVMNGGQTALFCLINILAGRTDDGARRKILFPLMPEYIGYADQCIDADAFVAARPQMDFIDKHTFKYRIDFDALKITPDVGGICVSRPTNPSGNVLTDEEVLRLSDLAREHEIPLIVDNAYGNPFPGVIFTDAQPLWGPNMILTLSLSKLGLPGTRTGIVVGPPEIAHALGSINSILSLASGNVGQTLVRPLLKNDEVLRISRELIRPFYEKKSRQAMEWVHEFFPDDLEYYVHKSEGALFLWLWLKGLPITTVELYERLKKRQMLCVPGSYFYFGLEKPWRQQDECLRLTFSQSDEAVREGLRILADEARRAYGG